MSDVEVCVEGHVAEVLLNRPDKHNSITMPMFEQIAQAGEALAVNPAVRVVILHGAGPSFCSGLDIANFGTKHTDDDSVSERLHRLLTAPAHEPDPGHAGNLGQHAVQVWSELPVPVIAAIRGHALGAGCQLAAAADLRVAAPDASFGLLEIRWGLVPDLGGIPMLANQIGREYTADLVFTGRTVDGTEAHRIGMVSRLSDDPLAAARGSAESIARRNPEAIRQAKRLIRNTPPAPTAESLADEGRVLEYLQYSANQIEAVAAQRERRDPVFTEVRDFG